MILNPETLLPKDRKFHTNKALVCINKIGVRFTKNAAKIMNLNTEMKVQILLEGNLIGLEISDNGYKIKSYNNTFQIISRLLGEHIIKHFQCEKIRFEIIPAIGTKTIFELKELNKN